MKQVTPVLLLLLPLALPAPALAQLSPATTVLLAQTTSPLEDAARSFISELAEQRFAAAVQDYTTTAQAGVSPQTLQQNWNDLVNASGRFLQVVRTQVVQDGGATGESVVIVTSQFESETRDLFVVLRGTDVVSFSPAE